MVGLPVAAPLVTASREGQVVCHKIAAGTGGQDVQATPVNKVRGGTGSSCKSALIGVPAIAIKQALQSNPVSELANFDVVSLRCCARVAFVVRVSSSQ